MDNSFQQLIMRITSDLNTKELRKIKERLTEYINYLLVNDFNQLVQLLYRIDIDERKLKATLAAYTETDSAGIIAEQIIQRLIQKSLTRKQSNPDTAIDDEEKW